MTRPKLWRWRLFLDDFVHPKLVGDRHLDLDLVITNNIRQLGASSCRDEQKKSMGCKSWTEISRDGKIQKKKRTESSQPENKSKFSRRHWNGLTPSAITRKKREKKIFEWIVKSSKPIACVYSSIINEKERWMARSVDFRVCVCAVDRNTRLGLKGSQSMSDCLGPSPESAQKRRSLAGSKEEDKNRRRRWK